MALPDSTDFSLTDKFVTCHQVTATIPTAGANVQTGVAVTITGAKLGDVVTVGGPTVQIAHLQAVTAQVTAADTVTLYGDADATGFTGASGIYNVEIHHKS